MRLFALSLHLFQDNAIHITPDAIFSLLGVGGVRIDVRRSQAGMMTGSQSAVERSTVLVSIDENPKDRPHCRYNTMIRK